MLRLLLKMNCFRFHIVQQSKFGFVLSSFENKGSYISSGRQTKNTSRRVGVNLIVSKIN